MTPELAAALGWDQPHEAECRCPRCAQRKHCQCEDCVLSEPQARRSPEVGDERV